MSFRIEPSVENILQSLPYAKSAHRFTPHGITRFRREQGIFVSGLR